MMTRKFFLLLATGIALQLGVAQAKTSECRWTDIPPLIDGRAIEAMWQNADMVTLARVDRSGPASKTFGRLLWDREYLYFFAEIQDSVLVKNVTAPDGNLMQDDLFEIFLKPSSNHGGYYEVGVNPGNVLLDCFFPKREAGGLDRWKNSQKFHIETVVETRAGGWSVEGRIPWRDFLPTGGRPFPGDAWSFTFARRDVTDGSDAVLSSSAALRDGDFHHWEDYAPLHFIGPSMTRPVWQTSKVRGSPEPPTGYVVERAYPNLKLGPVVAVGAEPGSDRIIFLEHTNSWIGYMILKRFRNQPDVSQSETLLALPDMAYGFAFHPNFSTNGFIYVGCNGASPGAKKNTRIVRYTMQRQAPWQIIPDSRKIIIEWPSDGHNGGDVCFGNDGMLYVTSGDGTSDSDANNAGQDIASLLSKVLRIDVDKPDGWKAYSVPKDNPFVGQSKFAPETWAYGLRNPWRITFDRESGQLWVGENGQDAWEYARLVEKGANYGWSVFEGSHPFRPGRQLGPQPVTPPTVEHSHGEFRSLTGGVVYRGKLLPELRGVYLYGDFSTGRIWGAPHDGRRLLWNRELLDTPYAITGFGVDPDGEPLVADYGGGLYRLARDRREKPTSEFPVKLSQTGLFLDVVSLTPDPALVPYSVNAPLWSDGAEKERFIALPGDAKIEWRNTRGMEFPEGAVLVKSFFLETESGNLKSRRRLETRLLTKQQGDWYGYTYRWNDQQDEAFLVPKEGADQDYDIRDSKIAGVKKQTWHFPSRSECMVCHTRAANFVLGLSEGQLNMTDAPVNGSVTNQLVRLERHGIFKVNHPADLGERAGREGMKDLAAPPAEEPQRTASPEKDSLLPRAPQRLARFAGLDDATTSLELKARSYLAANCAICHVESGGGNSAFDVDFITASANMRIINVAPTHDAFGIKNARLISPGKPDHSVLISRMSHRGPGHMPPLATSLVDKKAVALLREWILKMREQ